MDLQEDERTRPDSKTTWSDAIGRILIAVLIIMIGILLLGWGLCYLLGRGLGGR